MTGRPFIEARRRRAPRPGPGGPVAAPDRAALHRGFWSAFNWFSVGVRSPPLTGRPFIEACRTPPRGRSHRWWPPLTRAALHRGDEKQALALRNENRSPPLTGRPFIEACRTRRTGTTLRRSPPLTGRPFIEASPRSTTRTE